MSRQPTPLLTKQFAVLLASTSSFGFAWSFYLILPKFLATELSLKAGAIGGTVALGGLAGVAATPIVGKLVDRFGRRAWITAGNLMVALAGTLFLFVEQPGPLLYAAQIAQGMGFAFAFNAAGTLTADLAPADRMAQAIGVFGAANLSTNAISPATGEIVAAHYGWDTVFTISIVAALMAAVLSRFIKEPDRPPASVNVGGPRIFDFRLLTVYFGSFAFTSSFAALFTLHQPFAIAHGVTEIRSFFISFTIVALIMRLGFGWQIDRMGPLRASLGSMTLYALVPPLLGLLGPHKLWIVGGCMGFTHGVLYPAMSALALERADAASRGMVFSIMSGSFNAGFALFSLGLGLCAEHAGYGTAFVLAAAITLTGVGSLMLGSTGPSRERS